MSTTINTARLADKYKSDVVPALMKKFGYKTLMQAPKLSKICLNRGVNGAVNDKKLIDIAVDELSNITGQKAVATLSKKDISNFKLLLFMAVILPFKRFPSPSVTFMMSPIFFLST